MPTKNEFPAIFAKFKAILEKHEKNCVVDLDTKTEYFLNTKKFDSKNKPIFFAGTGINKISVTFYLMPVFIFPELLNDISPVLRQHLHGKCCFRFKKVEPAIFQELSTLTDRGAKRQLR